MMGVMQIQPRSRDEDSQSDGDIGQVGDISESFSVTDLSQIDGECDLIENCEEKDDTKILSPLSESRMSSSTGSPPWFLSDTEQSESKEDVTNSRFILKSCGITLGKIEADPNKIKNSPQKAESSVSEPEEEETLSLFQSTQKILSQSLTTLSWTATVRRRLNLTRRVELTLSLLQSTRTQMMTTSSRSTWMGMSKKRMMLSRPERSQTVTSVKIVDSEGL